MRNFLLLLTAIIGLTIAQKTAPGVLAEATALSLVWHFDGSDLGDELGRAVSTAGDVNGDGLADIVIGAPKDTGDTYKEGLIFLFFGCRSIGPCSSAPNWQAGSGDKGSEFGRAVSSAGDINHDGYADVLVGAPLYKNGKTQAGAIFVYHGSPTGPAATPDWQYVSPQGAANLGLSVSRAGDINGDNYDDVLVGAPGYSADQPLAGAAIAFYGSAAGLTYSQTLTGAQAGAYFGYALSAAGDVNCDGFADVLIGAPQFDAEDAEDAGAIFVYYGSASGLAPRPDWAFFGDQAGARLGAAVNSGGDLNGDGCAEIMAGAPQSSRGEIPEEGGVFVFYGSAIGPGEVPVWQAAGGQSYSGFGGAVAPAGDVNHDGYGDILIGAAHYTADQSDEGAAFIYFGGPLGLRRTAGWLAGGDKAETEFGFSLGSAGDLNGDGFADVLIGAPQYKIETDIRGRALVYLGAESVNLEAVSPVYLPLILHNSN